MPSIERIPSLVEGIMHYRNPGRIFLHRLFKRRGPMTIADRKTGISVTAPAQAYPMFGSTWYAHDYDVPACPLREGDTVVDIGANHGFFTCYAAAHGARVFAFEPNPATFRFLQENIVRNGFSGRVTAVCTAVADFDGETALHCSSLFGGGADTILPRQAEAVAGSVSEPPTRMPVKAARLATLLPPGLEVRLLKMDCEGAELAILASLDSLEPFAAIALEFHPSAYRVEALIDTILGFGTHHVYPLRGHIVHAVRKDLLTEFARAMDGTTADRVGSTPDRDRSGAGRQPLRAAAEAEFSSAAEPSSGPRMGGR